MRESKIKGIPSNGGLEQLAFLLIEFLGEEFEMYQAFDNRILLAKLIK